MTNTQTPSTTPATKFVVVCSNSPRILLDTREEAAKHADVLTRSGHCGHYHRTVRVVLR